MKKNKIIVVMPAFNAELTLKQTVNDLPQDIIDKIILVDDFSSDNTVSIAHELKLNVIQHNKNLGYGGNQKTCYDNALQLNPDIVVMIHPDYQYDPRVIPYAVGFINLGICDIVVGSRIRSRKEVLDGGMPFYKYISNRFLTTIENIIFGQNLGDFHSGFRVYNKKVLETINYHSNSNDFVFDTELLSQAIYTGFKIGDIPIPTRYFSEASSINLPRSIKYGCLTLIVLLKYIVAVSLGYKFKIFKDLIKSS
jgi:glycosyltransferase involved in cell wall biosynthesis